MVARNEAKQYHCLYAYDSSQQSMFFAMKGILSVLQLFPDHSSPDLTLLPYQEKTKGDPHGMLGYIGIIFQSEMGIQGAPSNHQIIAMSGEKPYVAFSKEAFDYSE